MKAKPLISAGLRLRPEDHETLTALGEGNLTEGIRRAGDLVRLCAVHRESLLNNVAGTEAIRRLTESE